MRLLSISCQLTGRLPMRDCQSILISWLGKFEPMRDCQSFLISWLGELQPLRYFQTFVISWSVDFEPMRDCQSDQLIGRFWTNVRLLIISDQLIGKIWTNERLPILSEQLIGRLLTNKQSFLISQLGNFWTADRETLNQRMTVNHFWSADIETWTSERLPNSFWSADQETLNQWENVNYFWTSDWEHLTNERLPIIYDLLILNLWTNERMPILSDQLIGKLWTDERLPIISSQLIRETLNQWETVNPFWSTDQGNFEPMRASQSFLIVKVSLLSTSTGPEIRKIPLPLLQKWQALILFIYFWDSVEPFTAILAGCKTYCARTWHNWGKENARNWSTGSKWGSRALIHLFSDNPGVS